MKTLKEIAVELANRAQAEGCRGVVIALSQSDTEHSYYHVEHRGPCLEVEGLGQRIAALMRTVWGELVPLRPSAAIAPLAGQGGAGPASSWSSRQGGHGGYGAAYVGSAGGWASSPTTVLGASNVVGAGGAGHLPAGSQAGGMSNANRATTGTEAVGGNGSTRDPWRDWAKREEGADE